MDNLPELITYVGQVMFERRLTDISGGNISARQEGMIYISPRYAGGRQHWHLKPEDIVSGSIHDDSLLTNPRFSREGKAHLAIYRSFPEAEAVIHAHPFHVQPFVVAHKPIEPVLESTQKFGVIEVIKPAPSHSSELANNIVAGFKGKEDRIRKQAAAVLIPNHGIVVVGPNLLATLDALERIDWNAWCILAQRMLA